MYIKKIYNKIKKKKDRSVSLGKGYMFWSQADLGIVIFGSIIFCMEGGSFP
jgi:hypothetical protein